MVVRGEGHAAVGKSSGIAPPERFVSGGEEDGLHLAGDALGERGEEVPAEFGDAEAAVGVGPFERDVLAGGVGAADRASGAEAGAAGDREDDVGARPDEAPGDAHAGLDVGEAAGEDAFLGLLVPAQHPDVRVVRCRT
jgi:hypothetical protein